LLVITINFIASAFSAVTLLPILITTQQLSGMATHKNKITWGNQLMAMKTNIFYGITSHP